MSNRGRRCDLVGSDVLDVRTHGTVDPNLVPAILPQESLLEAVLPGRDYDRVKIS